MRSPRTATRNSPRSPACSNEDLTQAPQKNPTNCSFLDFSILIFSDLCWLRVTESKACKTSNDGGRLCVIRRWCWEGWGTRGGRPRCGLVTFHSRSFRLYKTNHDGTGEPGHRVRWAPPTLLFLIPTNPPGGSTTSQTSQPHRGARKMQSVTDLYTFPKFTQIFSPQI